MFLPPHCYYEILIYININWIYYTYFEVLFALLNSLYQVQAEDSVLVAGKYGKWLEWTKDQMLLGVELRPLIQVVPLFIQALNT